MGCGREPVRKKNIMYRTHTVCRACGFGFAGANGIKSAPANKLIPVMNLGIQPLANDFKNGDEEHAGFAPLKVMFCPQCSLAQLNVVVRPDILYSHYSYITSASDTMKAHFAQLWEDMQKQRPIKSVLEIGSNTGDFLAFCLEHGADRVLGIDPAENLCEIAQDKGVNTIPAMFDLVSATKAHTRLFGVDAVVARHVFCHIDDWTEFLSNLIQIGDKDTIYCIEVPYAPDMLRDCSFDTIYHEHLSYLTIRAMNSAVDDLGMHIHSVKRYPIHGGAIVITLRRNECGIEPDLETWGDLKEENVTVDTWRDFAKRALEQQLMLKATIETLLTQGKTVAGFGASAKSTVWINAAKLTREHIRFICDNTPQKQYKFSPGSEIPIVDEGALLRELPDYTVCFAWNFMGEILKKQDLYRYKGGKFIVPVPEVRIV